MGKITKEEFLIRLEASKTDFNVGQPEIPLALDGGMNGVVVYK